MWVIQLTNSIWWIYRENNKPKFEAFHSLQVHKIFMKIDYVLGHKAICNKSGFIKYICNQNTIKLEINNKKVTLKIRELTAHLKKNSDYFNIIE